MKKVVLFLLCLLVVSCHRSRGVPKQEMQTEKEVKVIPDKTVDIKIASLKNDSNSLISVTDDGISRDNPELVVLLDPLYQRVRNDSIKKTIRGEEKWMSDFRKKLCRYYDAHHQGSDSLSVYEKADVIIDFAKKIYENSEDNSTMGMVIRNSVIYTFDVFQEYNLLSQMLASCYDEETEELVWKEWELYEEMVKVMGLVSTEIVGICYWGGSIVFPLSTDHRNQLSDARRKMYAELMKFRKGGGNYGQNGVSLIYAEKMLLDSLNKTIVEGVKRQYENRKVEGDDDWGEKWFVETVTYTQSDMKKLRLVVRIWRKCCENLVGIIPLEKHRDAEQIASAMLVQWEMIATSDLQ